MSAEFLCIVIPCANMTKPRLAKAARQLTDLHTDKKEREAALAALERYASWDLLDGECARLTPDPETSIRWYIAGGSTWGDEPSEEYTALCYLDPIYELLLGWARKDGPARKAKS